MVAKASSTLAVIAKNRSLARMLWADGKTVPKKTSADAAGPEENPCSRTPSSGRVCIRHASPLQAVTARHPEARVGPPAGESNL